MAKKKKDITALRQAAYDYVNAPITQDEADWANSYMHTINEGRKETAPLEYIGERDLGGRGFYKATQGAVDTGKVSYKDVNNYFSGRKRDRASDRINGIGKRKEFVDSNGNYQVYYEMNNAKTNAKNVRPGVGGGWAGSWIESDKNTGNAKPFASKIPKQTQESEHTLMVEEGNKTTYWDLRDPDNPKSTSKEQYDQIRLLDAGVAPEDFNWLTRVEMTASGGVENFLEGMKRTGYEADFQTGAYRRVDELGGMAVPNDEYLKYHDDIGRVTDQEGWDKYLEKRRAEDREKSQELAAEQDLINQKLEAAKIGTGELGEFGLDMLGTGVQMVPGIAGSMAIGAVAPGAAFMGFATPMYAQTYGNEYNNAILDGATEEEAAQVAALNATVEVLSEALFAAGPTMGKLTGVKRGIIPRMTKQEAKEYSMGLLKTTAGKDIKTGLSMLFKSGGEEGMEEIVAGLIQPAINQATYGEDGIDWKANFKEALYNGLVGAAMGGMGGAVDVGKAIRSGAKVKKTNQIDELIKTASTMSEEGKAFQLARRMESDKENVGRADLGYLKRYIAEEQQEMAESAAAAMRKDQAAMKNDGLAPKTMSEERAYLLNRELGNEADSFDGRGKAYGDVYEKAYALALEKYEGEGEANAEELADQLARSVARLSTGEGYADFSSFHTNDSTAREVFEKATGKTLPATNAETAEFLQDYNYKRAYATTKADNEREQLDLEQAVQTYKERFLMSLEIGKGSDADKAFQLISQDVPDEDFERAGMTFKRMYDIGYKAAMSGGNVESFVPLNEAMYDALDESQQRVAFEQGFKAGEQAQEQAKEQAKNVIEALGELEAKKKSGKKVRKAGRADTSNLTKEDFNDEKKSVIIKIGKRIANRTRTTIVFESLESIKARFGEFEEGVVPNGWYENGEIHIYIDGSDPLLATFSHEFTHHIARLAPEEYLELQNFIVQSKYNGDKNEWIKAIDDKMRQYGRDKKTMLKSRDDAIEELIADMAHEFLNDEQTIIDLFNYNQKVYEGLKKVITKLINQFLDYIGEVDKAGIKVGIESGLNEEQLLKARELWLNAAKVAKQRGTVALNRDAAADSGVKFKINPTFASEIDAWDESGRKNHSPFVLGATSDAMQSIGMDDYEIKVSIGTINKILRKHPEMTIETIKGLPEVLEKPILVMQSETVTNSVVVYGNLAGTNDKPVMVSLQLRDRRSGEIIDFAVVTSAYVRTNTQSLIDRSDILYVEPDKKRTDNWLRAFGLQLPLRISQYGSIKSITFTAEESQGGKTRFSLPSDPAKMDADYMDAVNRGDMEEAQRMVDEAAERAGYTSNSDYQGTSAFNGEAPGPMYYESKEERKEAWDNDEYDDNQTLGDYADNGVDLMDLDFFLNDSRAIRNRFMQESVSNLRTVVRNGNRTITMYRSVPADVAEGSFRNGDWITPSRSYAEDNAGVHGWGEDYRIIEQEVSIDDIWWDGNDINEWGFNDGTEYVYKNTENNRKQRGVTYDDNGEVIPLSKRFDSSNPDIRFSLVTPQEDADYMAAVESGDMETAQRMVYAAAERAGYDASDFRYGHMSPKAPRGMAREDFTNLTALREAADQGEDLNLFALANGISNVPNDYYGPDGARLYGYDYTPGGYRAAHAVNDAIRRYNEALAKYGEDGVRKHMPVIRVYRAIPSSRKDTEIRSGGDWVTLSREYAKHHGESYLDGYKIIWRAVPITDVWWDGNDALEWGYDDGKNYAYQNTKNNKKSLDPVTYDDEGNVIPLSKRFNKRNSDVRFSLDISRLKSNQRRILTDNTTWKEDLSDFTVDKIQTFTDVLNDTIDQDPAVDVKYSDLVKASRDGLIGIYSPTPFKQGGYVTTSRAKAESIAEKEKVYYAEVEPERVAWVDILNGVYADTGYREYNIRDFLTRGDHVIIRKKILEWNVSQGNEDSFDSGYVVTDKYFVLFDTWGGDEYDIARVYDIDEDNVKIKEIADEFDEESKNVDSRLEDLRVQEAGRDSNRFIDGDGRDGGQTSGLDSGEQQGTETDLRTDSEESSSTEQTDESVKFSLPTSAQQERQRMQDKIERLKRNTRLTHGLEPKSNQVAKFVRQIKADHSSDYSLNKSIDAIRDIYKMVKSGDEFSEIYGAVQDLARSIADASFVMRDVEINHEAVDLRSYFKTGNNGKPLVIRIGEEDIAEFDRVGGLKEFRKKIRGVARISTTEGMEADRVMDEIVDFFGEQWDYYEQSKGTYIDGLIDALNLATSEDATRAPQEKVYKTENRDPEEERYVDPEDWDDLGVLSEIREDEINMIIGEIFDAVETIIEPDLTFADRKKAEKERAIRRLKEDKKEALKILRETKNAKIDELKKEKTQVVKDTRAAERDRANRLLKLERERQRQKEADRRERGRKTQSIRRIEKISQRLAQKLLTPSDTRHIPERYRKAIATALASLDFESTRTDKWEEKFGHPSKRIANFRDLKDEYKKIMDQDDGTLEMDEDIYNMIEELSERADGMRLSDMSPEQVETVRVLLQAIEYQVNNANKMLTEGLKETRAETAKQLHDELQAQKGEKLTDTVMKHWVKSDSTPVHFFDRLGVGVFKKIYAALTKAQDTHIRHMDEAMKVIEGITEEAGAKNIKKWSTIAKSHKLSNGTEVEMTDAQIMSLYALNQREQARGHILGSGIVIKPLKVKRSLKGKISEREASKLTRTRVKLTYEDVMSLVNSLSDAQIKAADDMLAYMRTTSEWGNETSMKLYGYKKFTEQNYFPIQSAQEYIAGTSIDPAKKSPKMWNAGFTKAVKTGANNPVMLDDFFDVATAHINQMSQYNSFTPVLQDMDRIYHHIERNDMGETEWSVKELIQQKHGIEAAKYIEQLMEDINGNLRRESNDLVMLEGLLRNWKAAKIGLSLRVLAQQPTAVVRALYEIDAKYFMGKPISKKARQRMWDIAPIALWKHWGYSQTDIHRSMRDTMMGNKGIKDKLFFDMYGKADDIGWTAIFMAVERETQAEHPELEYDSPEYREHVNNRFREIVDRTQVVDSVLHRSQMMRSQNTLMKAATAFMAEPTLTINTVVTGMNKAIEAKKAGNTKEAAKIMTRTGTVFFMNAVAVSLMASLVSTMRETFRGDDDDDDEEQNWIDSVLEKAGFEEGSFMRDWLSGYFIDDFESNINPLNMIPFVKDIMSHLEGYDSPNPTYALMYEMLDTGKDLFDWMKDPSDKRYSGTYYIERSIEKAAELFGIPASNIRKEVDSATNMFFRILGEKEYGDYIEDRLWLNDDYKGNKNVFIDHYVNAKIHGHEESAADILEKLKGAGITDEDIEKRAWKIAAPDFEDSVLAGKNTSVEEQNLRALGLTQDEIDEKKAGYLEKAVKEAAEDRDTGRMNTFENRLKNEYGYGDYDVDKLVKSAAMGEAYDLIDEGDNSGADQYINYIVNNTDYTRDDIESSILNHYTGDYYDAIDSGDTQGQQRLRSTLYRYGVTEAELQEKEAYHYKDYYRQKAYLAYSRGDKATAYQIAQQYASRYPGVYKKGAAGMIYGLDNLSPETVKKYESSGKYSNWQIP